MRIYKSITYETGIFRLEIVDNYKFLFSVSEGVEFERTSDQVLAIMECQYEELGKLIAIVKEASK